MKIKSTSKISFFSNIQNIIKKNIKIIIYTFFVIIFIVIIFQIYFYNKNKQVLKLSIIYNDTKNLNSKIEFIENMNLIAKDKGFYGLMASLELISIKLKNQNYKESYDDYINLLNKKNIDDLYKTLLAIHASYNLLNKIDSNKLTNLLFYVDESFESFIGYRLEILYLLSLTQKNIKKANSLYDQIINSDNITSSIKERVKKINEFEKYK